jgi:hypothetical protein
VSDEQRAPDEEEQKRMANAGDDVQAHGKSQHPRADEGNDDGDDVEAHGKSQHPKDSAPSDEDDNDVEAHYKAGGRL